MRKWINPIIVFLIIFILPGCGTATDYSTLLGSGISLATWPATASTGASDKDLPILNITVMTESYQESTTPIEEIELWQYIREKTNRQLGYQMQITVQKFPRRADIDLPTMIASNDLPDVTVMWPIVLSDLESSDMTLIQSGKVFRELTLKDFQTSMPNLVSRVEQYGLSFTNQFLPMQQNNGRCWFIPTGMDTIAFPKLPDSFRLNDNPLLGSIYSFLLTQDQSYDNMVLRDDLLKRIYPQSKTEEELRSLFLQKQGHLTVEDITGNIPIRTLDDLLKYLVQIRDMNLKTSDGSKLIPACLNFPMMAMGYKGHNVISYGQTPNDADNFQQAPEFKRLLQWMNKAYQAGLLESPDVAAAVNQRTPKIALGDYAVISADNNNIITGISWANTLRTTLQCGLRLLPMGYGITDFTQKNNKYVEVNACPMQGVFLNAQLSDDKAVTVMKWLDLQMSTEFDELCYWGLPEWSQGEGQNRRFIPQYSDVEAWVTTGADGEGMEKGVLCLPSVNSGSLTIPQNIRLVSFFLFGYPDAPCYVLPLSDAALAQADMLNVCDKTMINQDIFPRQTLYLSPPGGSFGQSSIMMQLTGIVQSIDPNIPYTSDYPDSAVYQIVTDDTKNFEKNWSVFQQKLKDDGMSDAVDAARDYLAANWQSDVLDRVIQD